MIAALSCLVRATANIAAFSLLAAPERSHGDERLVAAGTFADGIACVIAGLRGVLGTNTF